MEPRHDVGNRQNATEYVYVTEVLVLFSKPLDDVILAKAGIC